MHSSSRALTWALLGGTLTLHINYMHSFSNIKCLVNARHCSGDIMVNGIDKIPAVMETDEYTMSENNKMAGGWVGELGWSGEVYLSR